MTILELAAPTSQPVLESMPDFAAHLPAHTAAPQSWMATVTDAKFHWYDLIAGFPERPDIHDPIGRYQRRMQFELEAVAERHHLFYAVTRPRVRFDANASISWAFFSPKLTLPLLMGLDGIKETLTFEPTVPFAATLKKPIVTLTPNFVTLNWGGLIEAFSIHDILRDHGQQLKVPSTVVYVGQTRDDDARLSKARLPALQRLHAQLGGEVDVLLVVKSLELEVSCAEGDAAQLPENAGRYASDALQTERMDVVEAALIRHFEGPTPAGRNQDECKRRSARVTEVQALNNLVQFTIDLTMPEAGNYELVRSQAVAAAPRHILSCYIADGAVHVARMPIPEPAKRN